MTGEDGAGDPPPATLRLDARTGMAGLAAVQASLEGWLTDRGAAPRLLDRAALVTEEVVLNIGSHGHGDGAEHPVGLAATLDAGGTLTLVFEDRARAFDPLAAPAPTRRFVLNEAPVGGMGLVMLRGLSDGLSHARREGGGNRLTVVLRGDQVPR